MKKKLRLELFDNEKFETKSLKAWLDVAQKVTIYDANKNCERQVKGLYASCYLDNEWKKCIVIGQKKVKPEDLENKDLEVDDRLLIMLRNDKQQKFWVPRLYVFIWGEDPYVYLNRLRYAQNARDETESLLKYQACVANMPLNNLNEMDQDMA